MSERFRQVFALMPDRLRQGMLSLSDEEQGRVEEIRLRTGQPPALTISNEARCTHGNPVEQQELELLLQAACKWSMHTVLDQLCNGYMTVEGGHRIGVVGTAVMEGERVRTICDISSINIRIARQITGCASDIALQITKEDRPVNTLIVAPPGGGKTTILRDLIRIFSQRGIRVSVADERGELAAVWRGTVQMDLGPATDVLTGCPKAQAIQILLRGMNPQVIAVDEITAPEDVRAMELAVGCGAAILATAHAETTADLCKRPLYRALLEAGVIERFVVLGREGTARTAQVKNVRELIC